MNLRQHIFLLFFWGIFLYLPPLQADTLDSLRNNVDNAATLSARMEALLDLSWEQKNSDPKAAWLQALEALEIAGQLEDWEHKALAFKNMGVIKWYDSQLDASRTFLDSARVYFEKAGDEKGRGDVLNNLALNFHITGDYGTARRLYEEALQVRKQLGDEPGMIITLINMGVMHKDLGDLEKALEMYSRALSMLEKTGDKARQADTYYNIGTIYFEEGQTEQALDSYNDALTVFASMGDNRGIADAHVNIGDVKKETGQLGEALEHYRTSLSLFQELDDKIGMAENLRSMGQIFALQENWHKALDYYRQSNHLSSQIEDSPGQATSMLRLGEVYIKRGGSTQNYDAGIQWLNRSVKLAEDLKMGGELKEGYELLAEAHAALGDFAQAYQYETRQTFIMDTAYNKEKARAISRLQTFYEFKKQEQDLILAEKETELAQAEANQRSIQLFLLLTILSAIVILMAVLAHYYRQKQAQNRLLHEQNGKISQQKNRIEAQNIELEDKNDRLRELNEEKNYLMGVVAHDLKNPMSQIKGLVNIIQMDPENLSDEQQNFLGLIDQSADRLTEMVHRILDVRAAESAQLNLSPEIVDLRKNVQHVYEQYQRVAANKEVQLHLDIPNRPQWANVDEDAFFQVLDNLVSNAIKFSPQERSVYVKLEEQPHHVLFSVKDEGQGLTKDDMKKLFGRFQKLSARPTGGESSSGLGLSIVKKYVEAMDGRVWCESVHGEGATFLVRFPKKEVVETPEPIKVEIS
jgi:signal transduction histidine kinase/tetratricopeptide (TPR) repeat protein